MVSEFGRKPSDNRHKLVNRPDGTCMTQTQ
jgi:hypothetical protein